MSPRVDASEFPALLTAIEQVKLPGQTDSQALLYWFLFNVYRLDEIESRDSVCDQTNDKGIDGVWADEDSQEIFLFQSVYTRQPVKHLGDTDLKEFVGSAAWFGQADNIRSLLASSANQELKALVTRLDLEKKIEGSYPVRLALITTRVLDQNGREYLDVLDKRGRRLDVWDRIRLIGHNRNLLRKTRVSGTHKFSINGGGFKYKAQGGVRTLVVPVKASDIASMRGLEDRSLFFLNVRSGLGRTRVNRELEQAIREQRRHDQFVLFHNGLTIICKQLRISAKEVAVSDYSVVNGCQSAIAFHDNRSLLTDNLRIIARFIEVGDDDALAEEITHRSNNQNGINQRDLKSNDRVQVSLRKEFDTLFNGAVDYVIKAGEERDASEVIRNDRAGQWLMAAYLNEPYSAHQKYKLFGSEYERVFGRTITAEKIYLSYLAYQSIEAAKQAIQDEYIRGYQLTNLILMGTISDRLKRDPSGKELLEQPNTHIPVNVQAVKGALAQFAGLLIPDFNFYVDERKKEEDGHYDYKSAFKSAEEYSTLSRALLRDYEKAIVKRSDESFAEIFSSCLKLSHT